MRKLRSIVLGLLAGVALGCDDHADEARIEMLQERAEEQNRQIAEQQQRILQLEQHLQERDADASISERLHGCEQRLRVCEQDPFKGGKYFADGAAGNAGARATGGVPSVAGEGASAGSAAD